MTTKNDNEILQVGVIAMLALESITKMKSGMWKRRVGYRVPYRDECGICEEEGNSGKPPYDIQFNMRPKHV